MKENNDYIGMFVLKNQLKDFLHRHDKHIKMY